MQETLSRANEALRYTAGAARAKEVADYGEKKLAELHPVYAEQIRPLLGFARNRGEVDQLILTETRRFDGLVGELGLRPALAAAETLLTEGDGLAMQRRLAGLPH
jgi:hypothetical protein